MRQFQVVLTVNVPDDVVADDYLNEVSFDCNHPDDGDIYEAVVEYRKPD
jgi:hypothetical protein